MQLCFYFWVLVFLLSLLLHLIQEKVESNGKKVQTYACQLLAAASRNVGVARSLSINVDNPLCKCVAFTQGSGEKDGTGSHEVVCFTNTKLPYIEKLPPYTTWIFLDRYDSVQVLLFPQPPLT